MRLFLRPTILLFLFLFTTYSLALATPIDSSRTTPIGPDNTCTIPQNLQADDDTSTAHFSPRIEQSSLFDTLANPDTAYSPSSVLRTNDCELPYIYKSYQSISTQIKLGWSVGYDKLVNIRWRQVGASGWTNILNLPTSSPNQGSGLSSGMVILTDLTPDAVYEWSIQTICSPSSRSDYSEPRTFTALCGMVDPEAMGEMQIQPTSVEVYWIGESGITFRIQLRPKSPANSSWQSLPDFTTQYCCSHNTWFNDLEPGQSYEWRIMTMCPNNTSSSYTEPRSFTTACAPPNNHYVSFSTTTSARLAWPHLALDAQYRVRWRRESVDVWIEGQPTNNNYYDVNSLQPGFYYWQVQRICGGQPGSYSREAYIIAYCYRPVNLIVKSVTSKSAQL